jgi:hypothetical protein
MTLSFPNRQIPDDIIQTILGLEAVALLELRNGNYERAESFFKRELEIILEKEKELKRSIHKGAPYYNLGLSQLLQNQAQKALKNILFAYIEDLFNVPLGEEEKADTALARLMLANFQITNADIESLKQNARIEKRIILLGKK